MDIRNWPLDQVMQLPDFCFGQRWIVGLDIDNNHDTDNYAISEEGLPEKCIIWGYHFSSTSTVDTTHNFVGFRLSDQVPADMATFGNLQRVFPGSGACTAMWDGIWRPTIEGQVTGLRKAIASSGRRIVLCVWPVGGLGSSVIVNFTVSSIPREVPDWLVSR